MKCSCGKEIPEVRIKMGYKTCVECSTEDKWGCSHLVFHKTGNTIEIIKDKDLCEQINEMAKRPTFGICNGMKGTYRKKKIKPASREIIKSEVPDKILKREKPNVTYQFEKIGQQALSIFEKNGIDAANLFLKESVKNLLISPNHRKQIENILKYFSK